MNEPHEISNLDESVAQVMQTLPPHIQKYLAQERYTEVAKRLMTKYGLRVDQAGILEREIMLLLMGIENPDEFVQALAEDVKLDVQTINGITKDVNDQIFVPLREEMRNGVKMEEPRVEIKPPPPPPINTQVVPPQVIPRVVPSVEPSTPPPPTRPYSHDPYREPIEP